MTGGPPTFSFTSIRGHGVDMVDVRRVAALMARDDDLLDGWFTVSERDEIGRRGGYAETVGGRMAAKEACAKALGTGFDADVSWQDIEVRSDGTVPPTLVLTGGARRAAERLGVSRFLLSISHTPTLAIASVIAVAE
ncbi:MAG: holo-ACP synthase [Phycisphaerales bacterium]